MSPKRKKKRNSPVKTPKKVPLEVQLEVKSGPSKPDAVVQTEAPTKVSFIVPTPVIGVQHYEPPKAVISFPLDLCWQKTGSIFSNKQEILTWKKSVSFISGHLLNSITSVNDDMLVSISFMEKKTDKCLLCLTELPNARLDSSDGLHYSLFLNDQLKLCEMSAETHYICLRQL
jgi:hypothetical protein